MSKTLIAFAVAAALTIAGCGEKPAVESVAGESPPAATLPTPAELATMPATEREQLKTRLMNEAAQGPDTAVDETMDMTRGPVLAAAGSFSGADVAHTGSGAVKIYQLPDSSYIVRLEDFSVTKGPALVVALVVDPDPRTSEDVERGLISIGKLKGNTGNQNYEVPAEFDVLSFGSVVIWCDLFGVMFAAAPLKLF